MPSIAKHNARVGVKSLKSHEEASSRNSHIFRKHGKVEGSESVKIFEAIKPKPGTLSKNNTLSLKQKKQMESRLQFLRSQDQITTDQENEIKKITTDLETKQIIKKNKVRFVELTFCVTKMPPKESMAENYALECINFTEATFGNNVELISLVVHLDQASLHAHVIIRIVNHSWSRLIDELANPIYCANKAKIMQEFSDNSQIRRKLLSELRREEKKPYFIITKLWHDRIEKRFASAGHPLNPLKRNTCKDYTSLPYFKEASQQLAFDRNELEQQKKTMQHLLNALPSLSEQQILAMQLKDIVRENDIYKQDIVRLHGELQCLINQKNDLQESLSVLKSDDDDLQEMKRIFKKS